MSTNYYSMALMQEILYLRNVKEKEELEREIQQLRLAIFSKQKKYRRCDKDIQKTFKVHLFLIQCRNCEKFYASDVALKLHLKLKHNSQKNQEEKSTEYSVEEIEVSAQI